MVLNITKAKELLFFLTCFLLPMNLFAVWRPSWAYLDGVFIDYWAPSLLASSIAVWLLCLTRFLELYRTASNRSTRGKLQALIMPHFRLFQKRPHIVLLTFLALILVAGRSLFTNHPLVSLVFLAETATGPLLFLLYLWNDRVFSATYLKSALLVSISFQALLAWHQFFTQSPLAPYHFFGEPRFQAGSFLAISQIAQTVRSLPYGGTPHPNILAAWLLLGILICISMKNNWKTYALTGIFFVTLLTTESLSSLISLPLLWLALRHRQKFVNQIEKWSVSPGKRLLPLIFSAGFTLIWQALVLAASQWSTSPSITRRAALLLSALQRWPQWFPLGTGLLQHLSLTKFALISSFQGRFLQPVHSSLFVLVIDLGIGGLLLLYAFSIIAQVSYSYIFWLFLGILPIFSLDHFGVTTLSGQYITLLLPLFLSNYLSNSKPVVRK